MGIEVEEVLAQGKGVCQDYAHLAVAMCRSQGIPARYVSGYLFTRDDSIGPTSRTATWSTVQTHAWFEAAVPGFGWLALDPTNQQEVGVRHVKIGHGRDYDDVQPLRGVFGGSVMPDGGAPRRDPPGAPAPRPSRSSAPRARPQKEHQQQQQ